MFSKKAFTVIEFIVVITILTIIASISFYVFSKLDKKEALEKDVASLTSMIREARLLSVASKNTSSFGVHFENDRAILFEGSSYSGPQPSDKVISFSNRVKLESYSLNMGGSDIVFSRLIGNTNNYGTVTLSIKDGSASSTITILSTGVIQ